MRDYTYFLVGSFAGLMAAFTIYFIVTLYTPVSDVFCFILGAVCCAIGGTVGKKYD